jgi:hypothetical protein
MNNVELEEILQMYHVTVCCADELPASIKNRPRTFVVNTDPCSKSGSHWTVFHFPDKGPCEFFDLDLDSSSSWWSTVLTTSTLQIEFNRQTA